MSNPAVGLAWCFLLRHRTALGIMGAYLLLLSVTRLPALHQRPEILFCLCAPFGFCVLYLMGLLAGPDMDLVGTRSGYPSYLLTLPVRTRSLVLWPMVFGALSTACLWVFFAVIVFGPDSGSAVLWLPAVLCAALTAVLQTIAWYPMPLLSLRWILIVVILPGLLAVAGMEWSCGLSSLTISAEFLAVIPICGIGAARGVAVARSGEFREREWVFGRIARGQTETYRFSGRPYASAFQAQFQTDWRRNGLQLTLFTALTNLLFALPMALSPHDDWVRLGIGHIEVHRLAAFWLISIPTTMFMGYWIGGGVRTTDMLKPDMALQPFLATRPLSTLTIVATKGAVAALSIAASWVCLLLFLVAWSLLPARLGTVEGKICYLLIAAVTPRTAACYIAAFLGLMCMAWIGCLTSLWVTMSGRAWFVNAYAGVGCAVMLGSIVWLLTQVPGHPEFLPSVLRRVPSLMLCASLLKAGIAIGVCAALLRRRLVSTRTLAVAAVIWLLMALIIFCLLVWQVPAGIASAEHLMLAAILALPFSRIGLAPLALDSNRHR